jgi:hypothetical protein
MHGIFNMHTNFMGTLLGWNVFVHELKTILQIEEELKEICQNVLDILDKNLIPQSTSGESKVFYYKM